MMHLFRKKRPASVPGASSQSEIRTVPLGYTPEFMLPDTLEASVSSVIGTRQEQQDSRPDQMSDLISFHRDHPSIY